MEGSKIENRLNIGKITNIRFLTDQAYEMIKEALLSLKLKPGERLVESMLAKELGISATPVRAALDRLKQEGLVEAVPFKNSYVANINEHEIEMIFELRELLEVPAIIRSAAMFSLIDLKKCDVLLQEMIEAFKSGDIESFAKPSQEFHYFFIEKFGNDKLTNILKSFDDQLERVKRITIRPSQNIPLFIQDYKNILAALRNKDPIKAEESLITHLRRSRNIFRASKTVISLTEQ